MKLTYEIQTSKIMKEAPSCVRIPRNIALRAAKKERMCVVKNETNPIAEISDVPEEVDYRTKLRNRFAVYYNCDIQSEEQQAHEMTNDEITPEVHEISSPEESTIEDTHPEEEAKTENVVTPPAKKKSRAKPPIQMSAQTPSGDPREINPVLPEVQMHETIGQLPKKVKVRPTKRKPSPKRPPNAALDRTIFDVRERSRHVQFAIPFEDGTILYAETSPRDDAPREGHEFDCACRINPPESVREDTDAFIEVEKQIAEVDDDPFTPNYQTVSECIKDRVADLPVRRRIQKAMTANTHDHLVVVLSEPLRTVEGVYRLADETTMERVWGETPTQISTDQCIHFWKYVPKRDFVPQRANTVTSQTDAVSIVV